MNSKRYFCGCVASPANVPNYCPEHKLPAINFDAAYDAVLTDERLKTIRQRISLHELRTLFYILANALGTPPVERGEG